MAVPPGLALFSLLTYDYKHCATILQELVCPVLLLLRAEICGAGIARDVDVSTGQWDAHRTPAGAHSEVA